MENLLTAQSHITLNTPNNDTINIGNDQPFVLFGGMNVLESKELAFEIAEQYVDICQRLGIGYVFKASFDKANRSSLKRQSHETAGWQAVSNFSQDSSSGLLRLHIVFAAQ